MPANDLFDREAMGEIFCHRTEAAAYSKYDAPAATDARLRGRRSFP